jgi:hypothetical protein
MGHREISILNFWLDWLALRLNLSRRLPASAATFIRYQDQEKDNRNNYYQIH